MAGPTHIPSGAAIVRHHESVALYAETTRMRSFGRLLRGPAPMQTAAERQSREASRSSPGYPIQVVRDLESEPGDSVGVDLINILSGKPTMGDRKLEGRGEDISFASMEWKINQYRHMVNLGGKMTAKRTRHNLRRLGRAQLAYWGARLEDQLCVVHLAGARGSQTGADWIVPLESDEDFSDIVVNEIQPPSFNRHFYANNATSIASIDSGDKLTLGDLDNMRRLLSEMTFPLKPIQIPGDVANEDNPLYCLYVSPTQWYHLQTETGEGRWRAFAQDALPRLNATRHPLFAGDSVMWNGFIVKRMGRAIRFFPGDVVKVTTDDEGTEGTSTVDASLGTNAAVDRAILLGAQALGEAYGAMNETGHHMMYHLERVDHVNALEASCSMMGGKAKLRFRQNGGKGAVTDHGVIVMDSYADLGAARNVSV